MIKPLLSVILSFFLIATPAKAQILTGTISTVDDIKPGMYWNDGILAGLHQSDEWDKIPAWLGGVWQYTHTSCKVLGITLTGADQGIETYGFIQDSVGDVWHCIHLPFVKQSFQYGGYMVRIDSSRTIVKASKNEVQLKTRTTLVYYSSSTRRIEKVEHCTETHSIKPDPPNCLDCVEERLDEGKQKPRSLWTRMDRLAFFAPRISDPAGYNYVLSFCNFLHSKDRDDLIPPTLRVQNPQ